MKKKTIKKLWISTLSLIGILALFVVGASSWSLLYSYITDNALRNLLIALVVLFFLVLLGGITWEKIKNKVKDIFT